MNKYQKVIDYEKHEAKFFGNINGITMEVSKDIIIDDYEKEIDRLNNIIDDAYNYLEDKNYVRGKDLVKVNDTDVNELYKILEKKVNNDSKRDV